ncbi:hypothetical protein [Algicola sagamiensis]|uniref:hypothetical protein n=1 Tax=Algicola sagamiensis TaxID=163869 RepID=UPI00036DE3FD|nr:hypothetical protein [Algicola sagamiensis]
MKKIIFLLIGFLGGHLNALELKTIAQQQFQHPLEHIQFSPDGQTHVAIETLTNQLYIHQKGKPIWSVPLGKASTKQIEVTNHFAYALDLTNLLTQVSFSKQHISQERLKPMTYPPLAVKSGVETFGVGMKVLDATKFNQLNVDPSSLIYSRQYTLSYGSLYALTTGEVSSMFGKDTWVHVWRQRDHRLMAKRKEGGFFTSDEIHGALWLLEHQGIALVAQGKTLIRWNFPEDETETLAELDASIMQLDEAYFTKGRLLYTITKNMLNVWSLKGGELADRTANCPLKGELKAKPSFSYDGNYVILQTQHRQTEKTQIFRLGKERCMPVNGLPENTQQAVFSPKQPIILYQVAERLTLAAFHEENQTAQ